MSLRVRLAQHPVAVSVVAFGCGLLVALSIWVALVYAQRNDPDRCPYVSGLRATSVGFSGWGDADLCNYEQVGSGGPFPEAQFAGPVDTTPFGTAAAFGIVGSIAFSASVRWWTYRAGRVVDQPAHASRTE